MIITTSPETRLTAYEVADSLVKGLHNQTGGMPGCVEGMRHIGHYTGKPSANQAIVWGMIDNRAVNSVRDGIKSYSGYRGLIMAVRELYDLNFHKMLGLMERTDGRISQNAERMSRLDPGINANLLSAVYLIDDLDGPKLKLAIERLDGKNASQTGQKISRFAYDSATDILPADVRLSTISTHHDTATQPKVPRNAPIPASADELDRFTRDGEAQRWLADPVSRGWLKQRSSPRTPYEF